MKDFIQTENDKSLIFFYHLMILNLKIILKIHLLKELDTQVLLGMF